MAARYNFIREKSWFSKNDLAESLGISFDSYKDHTYSGDGLGGIRVVDKMVAWYHKV